MSETAARRSLTELFNRWLTFLCIVIAEFLYGLLEVQVIKSFYGYEGVFYFGTMLYYILFTLLIFYWYPEMRKKENWTFILFTLIIFGLYAYSYIMSNMVYGLNVIIATPLQAIAGVLFLASINSHSSMRIKLRKSFLFLFFALGLYFYIMNRKFYGSEDAHIDGLGSFMVNLSGIWWQTCVLIILESVYSLNLRTFRKVENITAGNENSQ